MTSKILASQIQEASYARNVWRGICPHGTPIEAILDPEYWAHITKQLRPLDRIEMVSEDHAWFAELIVLRVADVSAKVKLTNLVRLQDVPVVQVAPEPPAPANQAFKIEWKGNNKRFTVIRESDKAALKDGFASKDEAAQWLEAHLTEMAA